ncbi:hypothetical protein BGX30_015219 [Mortierella sp. GBA39]|nr:hypothetical protein BGX30_015219 [Mortierella sp. GBA39]
MTTTTELRSPFSLMDDIMDELAGTTPDTPQPSHSSDLSDFGLAFELSRQLDINASEAKTSTGRSGNGVQKIVGKLEQNSAFKDNAFLQQARSGAGVGGGSVILTPPVSGGAPYRSTFNNSSTVYGNQQSTTTTTAAATGTTTTTTNANAPSYLRGRFQTIKEAEEEEKAQAAAAKLREASRKANAQLPSDDEGSDVSSEEDSDDEQRGFKKQQRLLAQQQHQHQLFLQQQAILQNELAGAKGGEMGDGGVEVKPAVINHEAAIDRMKGRHRALLQGAHNHAAREENYEDYRDEDDIPRQQYYPQGGIPGHPHANAAYNRPSVMNGMAPGYGYAHPPATMPSYTSGMQMPMYHHNQYFQGGGRGTPTPAMSHHIMQQQQFQQGGRSNSVVSDGSSLPNSSRRGSVQYSVVSSARVSEDSWNEASQQLQQQHHHHQLQHSMSALSTQKTADSDSGYSGVASDQGKHTSFDDSLEDIQTAVGSEYEKTSSAGTKSKVDDVAKVIAVLSISQAAAAAAEKDSDGDDEDDQSSDDDKSEGSDSDSDSEQDEDPKSLKGSTMIDSTRRGRSEFKSGITTRSSSSSSAAASNNGSNEHENDNDIDSSDDDDQPIILSRRNSVRGTFLPATAAASAGIRVSAEEAVMMSAPQVMQQVPVPTSNGQMQYMSAMNMYQQQPMHMSYMPPQQQPQQQPQPQQQAYIPMGYQFPGPQPGPMVPHHQHSYSVDRAMPPPSMVAQGPVARRVNPAGASKGHTSTGSSGSAIQSQYPIPATTLLHPGPRRSQSVRARPQATSPINSNTSPAAAQGNGQAARGRSSKDFVRLPGNGYQSMISGPINGPDFTSSSNGTGPYIRGYTEPLPSPPLQLQQPQQQALPPHPQQQHHQQMQQQMEKQQLQQGYFMSGPMPSQYGYMMQTGVGVGGDPYSAHPHQQQILQASRR